MRVVIEAMPSTPAPIVPLALATLTTQVAITSTNNIVILV